MTTVRKFCCNDLLDITPILIDQFATTHDKSLKQGSLSWYLNYIAEFDDYFLVTTSPGDRISGYCTSRIEVITEPEEKTKGMIITHVAVYDRYLGAEVAGILVHAVYKSSELIDKVTCFNILPSTNLNFTSLEEMPSRELPR
ncbi:hypothetical protein MKW94_015355 [Papaver nudicaule]|uniref:N-acetyltransferase domain-containing protein n=1 Tax=Papaver nudicaule TaxID=74823 RepID=A0AA41SB07_PAPNU|nr:hypothetical protein [Papaver nudicaule]